MDISIAYIWEKRNLNGELQPLRIKGRIIHWELKIIHQRRRPTIRLTSHTCNIMSWHDKMQQWHAWASVDVVNVTRNKASWGNIFLLYLLGYFLLQKIETFEDRGCALPPAPNFGSRLEPEPPPSLETQLLLLLLLWRPQVVVVGGWVGGAVCWPESCNLRLFQTTCTSFCNLQAQSRLTLSSTFDMGNNKL